MVSRQASLLRMRSAGQQSKGVGRAGALAEGVRARTATQSWWVQRHSAQSRRCFDLEVLTKIRSVLLEEAGLDLQLT